MLLFDSSTPRKRFINFELIMLKYNLVPGYDKIKENDTQKHLVEDCYTFVPDMLVSEVNISPFSIILTKCSSIKTVKMNKSVRVIPLLMTSKKSVSEPVVNNMKSASGPFNIAAAAEIKRDKIKSRIVLFGNGSFISDSFYSKFGPYFENGEQFFKCTTMGNH